MQYGNLQFLWFLWLVPLFVFFYIWAFKRKEQLINKFVSPELKERLMQGVSIPRQRFKAFLLIVVLLFAILSLIRPKWGYHWEEVKRRGVDIMIALDVSRSMLAEDVSPNRLERAKREIIDFLQLVEGDRIGLIAFAGTSFLQSPLTLDYGAVQIFLDDLDTDLIPVPGTAIGMAIETAIKSFATEDKKSRVLILITDGEDHGESPVEMAKKAAEQQIKIYSIGIGKEGGSPIPDTQGGFKKDRSGEMIMTKLDEETLQKIALNTGGSYVRSVSGDLDLEKIYSDIRANVEDKELKSGRRKRFEERFQWPLLIAILLLFWELVYSERKNGRKLFKFLTIALLFVSPIGFNNNAHAQLTTSPSMEAEELYKGGDYSKALQELLDAQIEEPSNYELKYNLGNTYYKMQDYENAQKLFESTAIHGDRELSQKSYYNLGNVFYRQGKLQEAVDYYKKALELDPDDQDAKYNLEFVREEIKRRIEENKKRQQQQQQQKQDQQQQDQDQQNQEQQKQDQQKQQDQKDKKQEGQQKDQEKDKQGQKEDKKKEEQGKDKKEDQKKDQQEQQAQAQPADKKDQKKMSEEEAQRWFNTLDEDKKKHLQQQMKGRGNYSVEKDW